MGHVADVGFILIAEPEERMRVAQSINAKFPKINHPVGNVILPRTNRRRQT